jgi:alpha-beta hydrolase superfamily lysophospholipase
MADRSPDDRSGSISVQARPVPTDGIGIELVREWIPESSARACVVLVHGIAEHCGRYERTGTLLAEARLYVRSFDLIGFGASGGIRGHIDDWSRYHDQIQRHVEWAKERGAPVVLMGHSMGGNLALGYALTAGPAPDLLVLSAPALAGGAGWQRALASLGARVAPTTAISNSLKGEWLSRDPAVAEAYFADPLAFRKSTVRLGAALFESMDELNESLGDLSIPTLVLHGGADPIVPPQSTVALGELPGVERRLYPGLRHEILNEPEGPEIVAEIVAWIDSKI